jgi:hypothetical protein
MLPKSDRQTKSKKRSRNDLILESFNANGYTKPLPGERIVGDSAAIWQQLEAQKFDADLKFVSKPKKLILLLHLMNKYISIKNSQ